MISKIGDSDASQDFATQSPRTNGHLTVTELKTTWYVMYSFCLCYSELLNKIDVVFFAVVNVAVDVFCTVSLFSLLFFAIFRSVVLSVTAFSIFHFLFLSKLWHFHVWLVILLRL